MIWLWKCIYSKTIRFDVFMNYFSRLSILWLYFMTKQFYYSWSHFIIRLLLVKQTLIRHIILKQLSSHEWGKVSRSTVQFEHDSLVGSQFQVGHVQRLAVDESAQSLEIRCGGDHVHFPGLLGSVEEALEMAVLHGIQGSVVEVEHHDVVLKIGLLAQPDRERHSPRRCGCWAGGRRGSRPRTGPAAADRQGRRRRFGAPETGGPPSSACWRPTSPAPVPTTHFVKSRGTCSSLEKPRNSPAQIPGWRAPVAAGFRWRRLQSRPTTAWNCAT